MSLSKRYTVNRRSVRIHQHYEGHRQRARQKLLELGADKLQDYEMVELMLFLIFKRKDVKPLAKELLIRFKSIDKILNAPIAELIKVPGIGEKAAEAIKIINGITLLALKSRVIHRNHINCFDDVINYCKINMKNLIAEELRVLFLNAINEIIADEVMQKGDINSVNIYPRMIARRCLELGAIGVILIHNHPSGDPTPSRDDVFVTKRIKNALTVFDISLQDHIIIADNRYISFKALDIL